MLFTNKKEISHHGVCREFETLGYSVKSIELDNHGTYFDFRKPQPLPDIFYSVVNLHNKNSWPEKQSTREPDLIEEELKKPLPDAIKILKLMKGVK